MGVEHGFPFGSTSERRVVSSVLAARQEDVVQRSLSNPHLPGVVAKALRLLISAFVTIGFVSPRAVDAEETLVRRAVLLQHIDGVLPYRIELDVDPTYLLLGHSALAAPTLFIGEQPIFHTLSHSGTHLEAFIAQLPAPTDTIWFASTVEFPNVQQARAHFDASGVPPIAIDIDALLVEGERQRKRITDVDIVVNIRTLPDGTERSQYVVKLTVENCTEESFAGFGPAGLPSPPDVFVGEQAASRTYFSTGEQKVVGEFDDEPGDGAEITLRYAYFRLTAPGVFHLP